MIGIKIGTKMKIDDDRDEDQDNDGALQGLAGELQSAA